MTRQEALASQPDVQSTLLRRGDRVYITIHVDGPLDREALADGLTFINAGDSMLVYPYSAVEGPNGADVVLLGEVTGNLQEEEFYRRSDGTPSARPRPVGATITAMTAYLNEELGLPCCVFPLVASKEMPETLQMLRSYRQIAHRFRDRDYGALIEIHPSDFVTADVQEILLSGHGELRDGFMVDRFFKVICELPQDADWDLVAAGASLANESNSYRLAPYYVDDADEKTGTRNLVFVGEIRRTSPMSRRGNMQTVSDVRTALAPYFPCPITIEAIYPSVDNPEHLHLKQVYDTAIAGRRGMLGRGIDITSDMFEDKDIVGRREATRETLKGQTGALFVGELEFPAGTDMMLVARANGILRGEHSLRVAPLNSELHKDGTRVVKVAGVRTGFFGAAMPLRAEDIETIQRSLGCKADVRLLQGTMEHPEDLEAYADAREALADRNAATSMAAWTKHVSASEGTAAELQARLIGLDEVMARIDEMVAYAVHYRKVYGRLPQLHAAFLGNAGTGKTTVARILAKKLGEAGVLDRPDRFVETDRSGLVGQYVGHTAAKTHALVDKAMGGMLFIDEAYSLNVGHERDFGREAVDALVKRLEDDSAHFVCVLAGYSEPMNDMLSMNPRLRSRIPFKIEFPDYADDQLMQIFDEMLDEAFSVTDKARKLIASYLAATRIAGTDDFANARTVRNLVQRLQMRQLMKGSSTRIGAETVESVLAEPDMAALATKSGSIGFAGQ